MFELHFCTVHLVQNTVLCVHSKNKKRLYTYKMCYEYTCITESVIQKKTSDNPKLGKSGLYSTTFMIIDLLKQLDVYKRQYVVR